jgi:hypothetical protein
MSERGASAGRAEGLWPMALAAILNERNHDDHDVLGGSLRPRHAARATQILASGWDVRTPGEAKDSLAWLFDEGHRTGFAADGMGSPESFAAWDWCRAANVAGWSFVAYLLDRETAWKAMLRAALEVQRAYGSWKEMGESYLRGMRLWAGRDDDPRVKTSEEAFLQLCADPEGPYRHPWKTPLEGAPPPAISQKVEEVGPGGSIADAVRRVGSGGRVVVAPGTYAESITPPHSVEIHGRGDGEVVLEAVDRPAIWAKSEVRDGHPRAISVALSGITLRAGRSTDGKTLNATSVPGGYLRLHDCRVTASHHGASVREGGVLFLSRTVVEGCGQSGVWCDGGSVAAAASEVRQPAVHGAYVARSPHANVFEDSSVTDAGQVGLFGEAELRVRRCTIEAPRTCGVAAHGPVWMSRSTVARSGGWGVTVDKGGDLRLESTTIEGSANANLDVKEGRLDARGSTLAGGSSSGLIVQGRGRARLVETCIEGHAQGNVYAIRGARLLVVRSTVRGAAVGLYLQDASAAIVDTRVESARAQALDVRGTQAPVLYRSHVVGDITVAEGARARLSECELAGDGAGEGARVEVVPFDEVSEEIDRVAASIDEEPQFDA